MKSCKYCGKEHDVKEICKGVTRRQFFFFGLATAAFPLVKKEILPQIFWRPHPLQEAFLNGVYPVSLYGIPYHQGTAGMGNWLGIPRKDCYPILNEMIGLINKDKKK